MEPTIKSAISGLILTPSTAQSGKLIRPSILKLIQTEHPSFKEDDYLSTEEYTIYREKHITNSLLAELGELSELEKNVIQSIANRTIVSDSTFADEDVPQTFGQRVADNVASFGGSWTFIISFGIFIAFWIGVNVFIFVNKEFDPYPFILLNLILSCIAALQAPVIMMSQNRREEKDRERAKNDYMINLKSEVEIRLLHEKMDHLMAHQQKELVEMQQLQSETMKHILEQLKK